MNKKLMLSLIAFGILLTMCMAPVSAFFTQDHEYWTIKGFRDVDSAITDQCGNMLDVVIDGNTAADVPVLHYFDDEFMSYISTHTRGSGYLACLERAGTDKELQCFCYGFGLHNVQDHFAHTEGGLVPTYLDKYYSSNLVGHMTTELSFQDKHMELVKDQDADLYSQIQYYDGIILDNLFEETGGEYKYLGLMNEISGLDMRNDANIFANGYKGQGFYSTVYKEKLSLPWWFWGLSFGIAIFGFGVAILFIIFGKTNWKYLMVFIYLMIALVGILIVLSFFTGNTWQWIQMSIRVVPITVADSDITHYDSVVQEATNQFLKTGKLQYDDNSGLSYVDRNGNQVTGALAQAEKAFQFIMLPLILLGFILMNIALSYKTFSENRKGMINRIMNILMIVVVIGSLALTTFFFLL